MILKRKNKSWIISVSGNFSTSNFWENLTDLTGKDRVLTV